MKYDCFAISRYVFLIFLVIVATYFIVENKKTNRIEKYEDAPTKSTPTETAPKGASQEGLTDSKNQDKAIPGEKRIEYLSKDPQAIETEVTKLYQELYNTKPTEEEVAFYVDYVKSRNVTRDNLREVIETSAPTLKKTLRNKETDHAMMDVIGTEREVILAFQEVLQRNPSREELYQFSRMLKDEEGFNIDKLKQVLVSSEEYMRMEKTQTNTAFVGLRGDVTDRQLTMIVFKLHKDVTGKEFVDEDTLRFLKKKFTEFNLNEDAMRTFIKNYLANEPFAFKVGTGNTNKSENVNATTTTVKSSSSSQTTTNAVTKEELETVKKSIREEVRKEFETSKNEKETFDEKAFDGKNYIRDSVIIFGDRPNASVLADLAKSSTAQGAVDSNKLVQNIKQQGSCSYFKDKEENQLLASSQRQLADYIQDRNRSHMKNVCERNSMYLNADDDMVLFPEFKWEVPIRHPPVCVGGNSEVHPLADQTSLIGTLLTDAKDTKVGNILPVIPPV